jgi:hypothetical protein
MRKTLLVLSALLLAAAVSGEAWAGGRVRFGVYVGGPYWGPYWGPSYYYYPPPYYYYPPPYYSYPPPPPAAAPAAAVIPAASTAAPPVPPAPANTPAGAIPPEPRADPDRSWLWWCEQPRGYFPQVKECATTWRSVPTPPPPGGG